MPIRRGFLWYVREGVVEEVASTAVGGGLGRGERERRGLSCRAGWMFAKLPGCRPRSKVVKAVGDGVGIGLGGFVGGHGEKLWVEFSRGCRWSSEEDQLPRSFLVLLLLQLPLLQGRWERGVEEGVANRYGRGRVCGSGGGSHRGRLRLLLRQLGQLVQWALVPRVFCFCNIS